MAETVTAPLIIIDRVERSRAKRDLVRLRLTGHWLSGGEGSAIDALLVVELQGRRHRFPASREDDEADAAAGEVQRLPGLGFTATFTIPDWAVPEHAGQAVVWVGDAVVPLPPPGTSPASAPAVDGESSAQEPEVDAKSGAASLVAEVRSPGQVPGGRSGPLADMLVRETVSALHAELEQRTAEAAKLRGALAQARSDLEHHRGSRTELESAHAELREELRRLIAAVDAQRAEFDGALAALGAERDLAREELDAARERFERELAAAGAEAEALASTARQETDAMFAAVRGEAETRAAEAEARTRELAERIDHATTTARRRGDEAMMLREQLAAAHVARDAALGEAVGLRAELERLGSELAVVREQGAAAGTDLTEARQLVADARALTERLRGG